MLGALLDYREIDLATAFEEDNKNYKIEAGPR